MTSRRQGWWRGRPGTAAAMAAVALVLGGLYLWIDAMRTRWAVAELRVGTAMAAAPYASSLGSALNKRLALVRGLAAFVAVEAAKSERGDLDEEFPNFAERLRGSVPGVRNISVAPDFVVRFINPVAGNEKVLGNELLNDRRPDFAATVRRAIDTRDVTTHGPLPLIQGGFGLIARQAVFVNDRPWGAVGAVFDLGPILEEANLPALARRYTYIITRADGSVVGDPAVPVIDPIVERIQVPDGEWHLSVMPVQGWAAAARTHDDPVAIAFLGIALLAELVVFLLIERRAALAALVEARTRDLARARHDADRKAEELAVAKRELEQFAYAAAHDLQEPVRTMGAYAQLLEAELSGRLEEGEARDFLTHIAESANRLRALLRDIQLYVAEDQVPLPGGPTPADAALDAVLKILAPRVAAAGAEILRAPLPAVWADERRLREILTILIGNAIEYRHPDRPPVIRIGARREGRTDVLTVADNGIGIEPRYHERIFEVFRRLHTRDEHPGTGMGLAVARKMAERLGGAIAVQSEPGRGSTFLLRLPLNRPATTEDS